MKPTVETMTTRDPRLLQACLEDSERLTVEKLFDVILEVRTKMSWYGSKWPQITRDSAVRLFDLFLTDVFEAIDHGALLHFKSPKVDAKPPVVVARLLVEKYAGDRDSMRSDLVERFKAYI